MRALYSKALIVAAAFALLSSAVLAGTPVKAADKKKAANAIAGKVVAVRGAVTASKGGGARRLRMKAPIYTGDTITSKRGRIQIMFTDKTLMNLGPNSQLVISKYLFEKGKKPVIETKLKEGVLRVMGGKIAKQAPKNFKVKTPTATIGIRGSMFGTSFRNGVTLVVHLGGKGVDVSTKWASVPLVRPQEGTYVRGGGDTGTGPVRPEPPKKLPLAVLETLIGATLVAGTDDPGMLPPPPLPPPPPGDAPPPGVEGGEGGEGGDPLFSDMFWDPTGEAVDTANGEVLSGTQSVAINALTNLEFEGYFVLGLIGPNGASLADDEIFRGLAHAISEDEHLAGSAIDGMFNFGLAPIHLIFNEPYEFYEIRGSHVVWDLAGAPRELPITYAHDNLGQTLMFWTNANEGGYFYDGPDYYEVNSLGYVGLPCLDTPGDGIFVYGGQFGGGLHMTHIRDSEAPANQFTVTESMTAIVNYRNKRFVSILWQEDMGDKCEFMISWGKVDGDRLTDIQYFGYEDRKAGAYQYIFDGDDLDGRIMGSDAQMIGFAGQGVGLTSENTQGIIASWKSSAAAFLNPYESSGSAPGGTKTMKGFLTGFTQYLNGAGSARQTWNTDANLFSLTANFDDGDVAGSASTNYGDYQFNNLQIGGSYGSAAVSMNALVALAGGGSVYESMGTTTTPTKNRGHGFVTDFREHSPSPWATWGFWTATFVDNYEGASEHRVVEGMWVAGQRTPASEVQALIDSSFSATYSGAARVIHHNVGNFEKYKGSVNLSINFGGGGSVSGSINAGPVNMVISGSGGVSNSGFSANVVTVNGVSPMGSSVQGIFCGPNAASVVGSARALVGAGAPGGYHATFIGNR